MKKMINIALLKVKLTFKDRGALAWMLLAPIIFITVLVFGFGGGGQGSSETKYPISIVDNDNGIYSAELLDMLKGDSTFNVIECSYGKAKEDVQGGETSMGIVIPEGFSESLEEGEHKGIEVLKLQDNESTMALTAVIDNYIYQLKVGVKAGDAAAAVLSKMNMIRDAEKGGVEERVEESFIENIASPRITYDISTVTKEKEQGLDGLSYTAIGILIIFIMFFVTGGAGSVLEEKELGTWNRITATPTRDWSILGGYILGIFILGWIQIGLLILVSKFLFHINWGSSVLALVILFSSFLLSIIGMGAALSSFVKSKTQLSSLTPIIVMPTCLLGGCMWPREIMPEFMLKVSNFVPQTWVLKGITDLVSRGSDISAIYFPSAVLMVFAMVFFITGLTFMGVQNK